MSQQDHHSPKRGLFAGRRVTVVQSASLCKDQLVGQQSVLSYQDAGVLTAQQMSLLQRVLPRTRLESLLASVWFQRRVDVAMAVSRQDLQRILRLAAGEEGDWIAQLGDSINLAERSQLWHWVLYPLHRWWVRHQEPLHSGWVNELAQLQVMRRQLHAQAVFWQTVVDVQSGIESKIAAQLAQLTQRERELQQLQAECEERLHLAWPAWYGQQTEEGDPDVLMPVPLELEAFWHAIQVLPQQSTAAQMLHEWLAERGLALSQDRFYWQPPAR
ncbi:T3SS regulon anti-activator ExsD domain-containing protein [Aeromonas hydrophila]|uniref:T3SS regulon anti-activator ExsD domain-containing protein n=1 Tax=Aeromonas hydrophila TaxID=644 RepID=UPI00191DC898|nr:T3SS regulon anti-activator ExsD domain-containing protein [Aeromonas hydrophila]MBL0563493.1 T3SS regulon anti-activator ExsD family protein [Aeromonas hydrophila]